MANTRELRSLTEKGLVEFEKLKDEFASKIRIECEKFNAALENFKQTGNTERIAEIRVSFVNYNNLAQDFMKFLKGHKSIPAHKVLEEFKEKFNNNLQAYRLVVRDLLPPISDEKDQEETRQDLDNLDKRSTASSNISCVSNVSVKAKLAAAKSKIQLAEQQLHLCTSCHRTLLY